MNDTMAHEESLERLRETIAERERQLQALQHKLTEHEDGLAELKLDVMHREQSLNLE